MTLSDFERYSQLKLGSERPEPTISVVIPAKNEARNLPHVLAGLNYDLHEVILVDGDSTDDTVEVARQLRPDIIVVQQTRKGKGNALACGFREASGDLTSMLWGDGFEVETLINVRIAKAGLRVAEVPSFEHSRHFGASNLNAFSDGVRVLRTIHAERKRGARKAARLAESSRQEQEEGSSTLTVLPPLAEESAG